MEQRRQQTGRHHSGQAEYEVRAITAWRVASVMRADVVTIAVDESVLMAWELLERSGSRHLPVVHPDGRCAGLLDRADLAVACAAPGITLSGRRVGDLVLRRRSAVVHAEETVREAANIMSFTGADALPVLGEHGGFIGLLTAADIVAALVGHRPPEPAGRRPRIPFPVMPGLPPRWRARGTGVP